MPGRLRKLFIDDEGKNRVVAPIPNFTEPIKLYEPAEPLFDIVQVDTLLFKTTLENNAFVAIMSQ